MSKRLSAEYLREMAPWGRVSRGRAIRLKCSECMGGRQGEMPRGEVAKAIDECGSVACSLWPFRLGNDPWRSEPTPAQVDARKAAGERFAQKCTGQKSD